MQHFKRTHSYLALRHISDAFAKSSNSGSVRFASNVAQSASVQNKIIIPKAIKRGPTDILEALAATVKMDHTAPDYRYIDDPFLTPISTQEKKSYSLAKEAGRRAAHYFFDKYPEHFHRDISEPKIEAFTYKEVYDESMEFEEFDLQKCITRSDISNAIVCYNKLVADGKPISEETLLDLLDLVSFYNGESTVQDNQYIEEDFFKKIDYRMESNFWKDNGFAEQLFDSLEKKSSRAYSSLIQGMCKYFQTERAFAFYKQALDQGLTLNVQTYNSLVLSSYDLHSTNEERWKTVLDILRTMQRNEIKPDLGTLNSALKQVTLYKFWNLNNDLAKQIFNEFAFNFGIEPSLATYSHLLSVFYRSRGSRSNLIYEVMSRLNSNTFKLQDREDVKFFVNAMEVATNLNDLSLAYQLLELVETHPKLAGKFVHQGAFYNRLFKLLVSAESIENFMVTYTKLVPHTYTPSLDVLEQILKNIKVFKALHYLPQIWNDIVMMGFSGRIEVVEDLLTTMNEIKIGDPLLPGTVNLVTDIWTRVQYRIAKNAERGITSLQWTARSLSSCIAILVKGDDIELAYEVMQKLNKHKDDLLDQPNSQALIDFINYSIKCSKFDYAIFCIKYCKNMYKEDVLSAVAKEWQTVEIGNARIKNELAQYL